MKITGASELKKFCIIAVAVLLAGGSVFAAVNSSAKQETVNQCKDEEERKFANLEKQRLSHLLNNARTIELRNLGRDKYFRIDADVYIDGEPLLPKLNQQYLTGAQNEFQ